MCRPLLTVFDSLNKLAVMQMIKMGEGRSRGRERGEEKAEVDGDRWRWREMGRGLPFSSSALL